MSIHECQTEVTVNGTLYLVTGYVSEEGHAGNYHNPPEAPEICLTEILLDGDTSVLNKLDDDTFQQIHDAAFGYIYDHHMDSIYEMLSAEVDDD